MINNGLDVHEATAKMLNHPKVDRQIAKTINFMLLYGGGTAKLAKQLNIPETTARAWRSRYFDRLPYVQRFLERTIRTAKIKGHIHNWAGRRCYLSSHKGAYIMPNHLIQGGCADIIKSAMVKIDKLLVGTKSAMLIQVHDELILEMHKTELDLIPKIKAIMESIYQPKNNLKLTCGVEHSWVSLAPCDKVEGLPSA
jgi:DNA polymerase-1